MVVVICSANAQSKAKKDTTGFVEKSANKTAEIAVKGKATLVDKVYKDKVGPNGQKIYIDRHSKYYWVDKKGHNVYIAKSKLRPKTN
ncbi:hypothetical protein EV199_0362 [Pseudobacter ginsenosidimutans]|uniref:Uncharacterized protein n=2 Tax=Pseudobacter ginsenosidimutans TaxID=661488 RepID=A0A4Q7N1Q1_9BACT|nr:hypothetical protein EV199_0362 [Pseudobacter ginsenosidimutans]